MDFLPVFSAGKSFKALEIALLVKDRNFQGGEFTGVLSELTRNIIHGEHLKNLRTFAGTPLGHRRLFELCAQNDEKSEPFDRIRAAAIAFLTHTHTQSESETETETQTDDRLLSLDEDERGLAVLLLGVSYLELYCRCNFTGPELSNAERAEIDFGDENIAKRCIPALECDGNYPYSLVDMPLLLLLARSLISLVADAQRASWRRGVRLAEDGAILKPAFSAAEETAQALAMEEDLLDSLQKIKSAQWWNARATVLHVRLLQRQSYDEVPTLWQECTSSFRALLQSYANLPARLSTPIEKVNPLEVDDSDDDDEEEEDDLITRRVLTTNAWLEWGLALHHFVFGDHGKKAFAKAKQTVGLQAQLSAALGKRTKYQREEIAQLFLFAKSQLIADGLQGPEEARKTLGVLEKEEKTTDNEETGGEGESGREEYEWEIGRRAVNQVDANTGEEAAVREILLDTIDTGAAENIILEGGPRFADKDAHDDGGDLHPLDQAVILSLCLDVQNSNPVDGLTNAEMLPYVERVLQLAKNWMIHSTALLQRSWLEFERRKTADRAMLQIQALIDQHTTRLTIFQSTFKSIEESAPAQDRLLYLYQIIYPSQFELKRDLALKYLSCQVFQSALNYFKELEMWDEVVTCYQLMQKPHRAEIVVREQLKISESPSMVNALADLTGKEELYERAWEISKGRYPRSKRTLGKICHDRGDYEACCKHLDAALAVQPLIHTTWYLKGISCMKLSWWEEGLQAFVRCVQQEPESGEAWTNMGAIYMRLKQWSKAYHALTEAAKHKREDFRVFENLMMVNLAMSRWKEAMRHMQTLLDMRYKSQRPLHIQELGHLIKVVVNLTHATVEAEKGMQAAAESEEAEAATTESTEASNGLRSEEKDIIVDLPDLGSTLETLLQNITYAIKSDPAVWDLVAIFQASLGRYTLALDARVKQWRAVISDSNLEKDEEKLRKIPEAAETLIDAHRYKEVTKDALYASKMLLQTTIRRMQALIDANMVSTASDNSTGLLGAYQEVKAALEVKITALDNILVVEQ